MTNRTVFAWLAHPGVDSGRPVCWILLAGLRLGVLMVALSFGLFAGLTVFL
jgi:hypothetical protein